MKSLIIISAAVTLSTAATGFAADAPRPRTDLPIRVVNPHRLSAGDVSATRTPLGIPNDYKPWIAQLKNGQLLIVAFSFGGVPSNEQPKGTPYRERAIFWRSDDGGRTWGSREERMDVPGREFTLNCLADGTLIMPCHFLANDAVNKTGYTHSKYFRSTDHGHTWSEHRVGPEGFPARAGTSTDWSVLQIPDPQQKGKLLTLFGVSMQHGGKGAPAHVFLWQSRDSGATWDKSLNPDTAGWIDVDGFFSQSTTYRAADGRLLHPVRVDRTGPHWKMTRAEKSDLKTNDQGDRMMLWQSTDNGHSWRKQNGNGVFGTYGEMYPRFLRLTDGRLLLTFTVRSGPTDGHAIGLRAIISYDDGRSWDFTHDRLVIDAQNQGSSSGGGFGNTIQLANGKLVSCYSYRDAKNKTHVEAIRWQLPKSK